MNEKKMIKKLIDNYNNNKAEQFNDFEELSILKKLLIKGKLNEDAFKKISNINQKNAQIIQLKGVYPLSKKTIEEIEKNIYSKIRDSLFGKIIRDVAAILVFIISVILMLKQLGIIK